MDSDVKYWRELNLRSGDQRGLSWDGGISVESEGIEGDGQWILEEKNELDRKTVSTKTLRWAHAWSF